jgi:hypothetical protein
MTAIQLQLDLWQELKEAELAPEASDLRHLCQGLEAAIATTPPAQKLQTAARAFLRIAEIFSLRAGLLLTDWEQSHSEEGPPLEDEDLSELLRQSMSLCLEELIAEPEPITRQRRSLGSGSEESVAWVVEKEVLLEAFDTEIELPPARSQSESGAVGVAHSEDVTAWAAAMARWLRERSSTGPVSLLELQQGVEMPLVQVWLGLLLGSKGIVLEQQGEFYSWHIWVTSS